MAWFMNTQALSLFPSHTWTLTSASHHTGPLLQFEVSEQKALVSLTPSFPYRPSNGEASLLLPVRKCTGCHSSERMRCFQCPSCQSWTFSNHISDTLDLAICSASIQLPSKGHRYEQGVIKSLCQQNSPLFSSSLDISDWKWKGGRVAGYFERKVVSQHSHMPSFDFCTE